MAVTRFLSRTLAWIAVLAIAAPLPVWAGGELFEGCLDSRGRQLTVVVDHSLSQVALARVEGGKAVLHHNPARLPELSERARMFFFAHECARVALGHDLAQRSMERARQADCWAVATLERSGQMASAEGLRELETELIAPEDNWAALSGPPRTIDLSGCSVKGGLRLPSSAPPSDAQMRVDRCVQICGDRLWQCQNRCGGESCRNACLGTYGSCESACGKP